MAALLERLQRLLALTESPNENEARNAAVLAAKLIRQHGVVFSLPEPRPEPRAEPRAEPRPAARRTPPRGSAGARKKTPASSRTKRVADVPAEIVSPLGGDCIECGGRYRAGSSIYWLQSGGGLHVRCFADWSKTSSP